MANVDFKVKKGLVVSTTATILSTNNATSTLTGALIVSGGAGIGQNLYVGSNTNIAGIITATNTTNSTSTSSGALQVIGGVGIGGNLYVGGNTNVSGIIAATNTTNSTSTTTGAITISGGLGVNRDVFIGGNLNIAGQIIGSGISGTVDTATNILVTNDASTNNDLYVTFVSTSSGSTGIKVDSDGIRYNPNQNSLKLLGSTSATSTTTGALQVTGGVGIGGDLWVGGAVFSPLGYIENSRTTGAVNTASWWLKCLTFSLPNIGDSTQFKFKSIIKYFNNVTYSDNSEQDVLWISAARDTASTIIGTFFWNNESSESAVSASSGNHILTYNTTTGVVEYWRRSTQIGGRAFVLIQEEVPANADYKSVAPTILTSENWISTWTSLGSTLTIDDPDTTSWEDVTITGTLTHSGTLNHTGATANLTNATSAVTLNLAAGATTTGTTKTINIGTAGVAGSTANINVGSSVANALGQLSIYSTSTKILATTPSTSTTTGALQITGGVGIGGELWVDGLINGTLNGNAATASKWQTARTVTLSGDLGGEITIDGSQNVILTATIQADSVALGTDTTGIYIASGSVTGYGINGSANTEGSNFAISINSTSANTVSTIVFRDANGDFRSRNIVVEGTASSTSTVTGALQIVGGVGVGGNLYIGGTATIVGSIIGTVTTATNLAGGSTGAVPYQSSTGTTAFVAASTSGYVLTTQGAGAAPAWTSPAGLIAGNADKANQWTTARSITLAGDLSGIVTINGTQDVILTATIQADSVALGTDTTGIYVASGAVSGYGLSGSASTEGSTFTVTSNATSSNVASTIVFRDASGNFSAGTITATATSANNLTGGAAGSLPYQSGVGTTTMLPIATTSNWVLLSSGSAPIWASPSSIVPDTAQKANQWTTARSITLAGDLSGVVSIDGSQNVTLTATIQADSVALGTDTTGIYVASGAVSGYGLSGSASTEGSTFTVTSNATSTNNTSTIVFRDANGDFSARSVTLTGNLTVQGTTFTVNSTVTNVSDPIFVIGTGPAGADPTTDDNKDRGIAFKWHNGTSAKIGFFGFDDSSGKFTFIPDSTISNEVVSGTVGTIVANLEGSVIGTVTTATTANRWTTSRSITLEGDLGGVVSIDGSQNVILTATIQADSVELGTDTIGDFVSTGGTLGYGLSGQAQGEGSAFNVESNATSSNVVSTIVFRDSNGDFRSRNIVVEGTASATSTVTGALQVAGGIGIQGELYVYKSINIGSGLSATTGLQLNNNDIIGVNKLVFADPGPGEGIDFNSNFQIYESPDNLVTNSGGNLQFVANGVRRVTFNTNGQVAITTSTSATSTTTGALLVTGGVGVGGNIYSDGIVKIGNHELMGTNTWVRKYASGYSATHTPLEVQEIGRLTLLNASENITITGEVRAATGNLTGVSRFILAIRSNTLPSKSFSLYEDAVNLGIDIQVKVYENTTTGLVVIGYVSPQQIQNIGWTLNVQERGNYNYLQQVTALTTASTATLAEIVATSSVVQEVTGIFNVLNSSQATSTTTGALRIAGGAGISGNLYVGGTIFGSLSGTVSTASNVVVTNDTSSVAVQYITFVSGTSGNLPIKVDGSELVFVPSTGRLGIGNASPQAKLHVSGGNVRIDNNQRLEFVDTSGNTAYMVLQSDNNFVFYNSVGTPIWSATSATNAYTVFGGSSTNRIIVDAANNLTQFTVNGSERVRINSSGNMGIANTSPGARLHIGATTADSTGIILGTFSHYYRYIQIPAKTAITATTETFSFYFGRTTNGLTKVNLFAGGWALEEGTQYEIHRDWGLSAVPKIKARYGSDITEITWHYTTSTTDLYDLHLSYTYPAGVPTGQSNYLRAEIVNNGQGYFNVAAGVTTSTTSTNLIATDFNINAAGLTLIPNTTQATSTTTGALQVSGGAGIGGNLYVGGSIVGNLTGNATSVSTVQRTTNATHFFTFVDSDNASATGESIYTTASITLNPSTGNVGIGTTPGVVAPLTISRNFAVATGAESFGQVITSNYSIADTSLKQSLRVNSGGLHTSGVVSNLITVLALNSVSGVGGTTTNAINYWSRMDNSTNATVTNAYNIWIENGAGSGSSTNLYGLYVNNLTKGSSSNYAIYTAGTTPNYFGGNVGIGITAPTAKLDIGGSTVSSTQTVLTRFAGDGNFSLTAFNGNTSTNASGSEVARFGIAYSGSNSTNFSSGFSFIRGAGSADGSLAIVTNATEQIRVTSAGNVGIGTTSTTFKLEVNGAFAATTKSFLINHPTKPGMKLRYGSLEGPENGVYVRGKLQGTNVIELPDYWTKLVDPDSITVTLTPIGNHQNLYVEKIENNKVFVKNSNFINKEIHCFYMVNAERSDVEKLKVEI